MPMIRDGFEAVIWVIALIIMTAVMWFMIFIPYIRMMKNYMTDIIKAIKTKDKVYPYEVISAIYITLAAVVAALYLVKKYVDVFYGLGVLLC